MRAIVAVVAVLALMGPGFQRSALAREGTDLTPPRHRVTYSNMLAGRYNSLGLSDMYTLGYQLRLWDRPGVLFKDTYLWIGTAGTITPAFGLVGGKLEVKPLAVLQLWAQVQYFGNFDTFGIVQSFPSPADEHSDTRLDENDEKGLSYTTSGWEAQLGARAQAKVWNIAVRDTLKVTYADMELRYGDNVY